MVDFSGWRPKSWSVATYGVILLTVAIYHWQVFLAVQGKMPLLELTAIPSEIAGSSEGPFPVPRILPTWMTAVTYIFIHASLVHLLCNIVIVWFVGRRIEERLGAFGFIIFYLAVGAASIVTFAFINSNNTIILLGSSASTLGLAGAYAVLFGNERSSVRLPHVRSVATVQGRQWVFRWTMETPIAVLMILILAVTLAADTQRSVPIVWQAHALGFLFGSGLSWLIRLRSWAQKRRGSRPPGAMIA